MIWFFVFGGLLACTGSTGNPVSAPCQLEMSPPRVVVRFGGSFTANCSSPSEIEGIGWESTHGGTGLQHGASFIGLHITGVDEWIMEPQCYASLQSDGSQCVKTLPVTVYKTPESVTMSQLSRETGPMVEGQQYFMECHIVEVAPAKSLSVHWHKGDKIIYTETFKEARPSSVSLTSVFSMIAHGDDNGSPIWCEAKLNLGSAEQDPPPMQSKSKEMTVLYPPTFAKPENETVELPAGGTISLDCTATGNPVPAYSWDFPDPTQELQKKQNVNESIFTPSFQLPGTYACTVSNSQGNSTKYFNIIEDAGDRTTFGAIVGVFVALGVLLLVAGVFFVTPSGTFSCNKGSYL